MYLDTYYTGLTEAREAWDEATRPQRLEQLTKEQSIVRATVVGDSADHRLAVSEALRRHAEWADDEEQAAIDTANRVSAQEEIQWFQNFVPGVHRPEILFDVDFGYHTLEREANPVPGHEEALQDARARFTEYYRSKDPWVKLHMKIWKG